MKTSLDLKEEIIAYLKTIPEVVSCRLLINHNYIYIEDINNSSLKITANVSYYRNNDSTEHFANLLESGLKQNVAFNISQFLLKALTTDTMAKNYNEIIRLTLDPLQHRYIREQ